jgi:hypothetical protein
MAAKNQTRSYAAPTDPTEDVWVLTMSASTNPVHALVARLNERGRIGYADIVCLLDALIETKSAEFARDLRQHGMSPDEIESSMTIQTELAREWKAETLREVVETFGDI